VATSDILDQLPEGEIVLVDTRQHWMAAIRFALKPILLVGAVVLLALLNQWLDFGDGFLGIINTLINWILVIMIIVAVIWLPINLVQWYSRKYVLTNRRAIRATGVLRKQTFDASLEKINDIGLQQSVFGRALGYADLTLYTASDAPNESWNQLIDGLQFKKAALNAKEGLRIGQPLQALAEGFIVKGGTNEVSMRADGKIKDPPLDDGAPPAAGESAAVGASAAGDGGASEDGSTISGSSGGSAVASAAEDVPAAPAHATPLPEPVGPITAEPVTAPAMVVEPEADPEPAPQPEPEPRAEPELAPEAEPESEPEPRSEPEWPEEVIDASQADTGYEDSSGDAKPA
jgi:hypothetical protein